MTALPAARAAATPPVGMATGKFQGEATTVTSTGAKRAPTRYSGSCRSSEDSA